MKKYEHKIIMPGRAYPIEKDLNELGEKGWQVVALTTDKHGNQTFVLKREKEVEHPQGQ